MTTTVLPSHRPRRGDALTGILVLIALIAIAALLAHSKPVQKLFSSNYAQFNAVQTGWSEQQVRTHLGQPAHEHGVPPPGAPDWKVSGYVTPERGITGKVLIYLQEDVICYCFLDQQGKVEETFVGGS